MLRISFICNTQETKNNMKCMKSTQFKSKNVGLLFEHTGGMSLSVVAKDSNWNLLAEINENFIRIRNRQVLYL